MSGSQKLGDKYCSEHDPCGVDNVTMNNPMAYPLTMMIIDMIADEG